MADAQRTGWVLRQAEKAVELARKVGRPLTFFATMGFLLVALIQVSQWMASGEDPMLLSAVPLALVITLGVNIICALIWVLAKLKQNPKAFQDE